MASVAHRLPAAILAAAMFLAVLAGAAPQATGGDGPGQPDWARPADAKGDPAKFDHGFYEKIQDIIVSEQADAPSQNPRSFPDADPEDAVPATPADRGYHTIFVVSGYDDPRTAALNQASLAAALERAGATIIHMGQSLPFVTAEVPVHLLPEVSLLEEVAAIGDGELPVVPAVGPSRETIRANLTELATLSGRALNGSGVSVAVLDSGINGIYLNDRVVARAYCLDDSCGIVNGTLVGNHTLTPTAVERLNSESAGHGTTVAHIIAASGLSGYYDGIAPGVNLMDAHGVRSMDGHGTMSTGDSLVLLDWAVTSGADVINASVAQGKSASCLTRTTDLIRNQAMIKGAVLVYAAGNRGYDGGNGQYLYETAPGCSANQIVVGGINDMPPLFHTQFANKGPVNATYPRLSPHMAAPSSDVYTVTETTTDSVGTTSGTSFAAPMVSAAAALLLQLKPDMTPAETKSLLLLGANWTGPVPCSSNQYEQDNPDDYCSYSGKQLSKNLTENYLSSAETLRYLNHVGFGILDVYQSVSYARDFSAHVLSAEISPGTSPLTYGLNATGGPGTAKVLLTWLVTRVAVDETADLDLVVICPGSGDAINASSTYQTTEFAVFHPPVNGTCAIQVSGSGVNGTSKEFALAATHPIVPAPSFEHLAVHGITVNSTSGDGTYLAGERVLIAAAFPRAVQVSGNSPPHLSLDTNPAGGRANYTGTNPAGTILTFVYQVGNNQTATDLDYTGTDALVLPSDDSITDALTGIPLRPVLPSPGDPGSLGHANDIIIDGTQELPAMASAETIHPTVIAVHFNKPVDAGRTDGAGWTLSGPDAGSPPLGITGNTDPAGSLSAMNLTLSGSLPAGASDLTVTYEPPSSGGVADRDGNHMAGASIPVDDRIRPALAAVLRDDPVHQATASASLTFRVNFSEPVTGVDRFDFEPSGPGTVTEVTGSGSSYLVDVAAHGSGSVGLGISPSHDIADPAGNLLADAAPDPDQTYLVDLDPPALSSAAYSTGDGTLTITFSEPLNGTIRYGLLHVRDAGESSGGIALDGTSSRSHSGATLTVVLTPAQQDELAAMTAPQLDIDESAVFDLSGNPTGAAPDWPITVNDATPPPPPPVQTDPSNAGPTISLRGGSYVVVLLGGTHSGPTCHDTEDGAITGITSTGVLDTGTPGTYHITYTCTDSGGLSASATQRVDVDSYTVRVAKNPPNTVTLHVGDAYADPGAWCVRSDGHRSPAPVSSSNVNTAVAGTYLVFYECRDGFNRIVGNNAARHVIVVEAEVDLSPVIIRPAPVTIYVGDAYVDPGVTCTDDRDPNPTVRVAAHDLDISTPGEYYVYYTCEDDAGNQDTAVRTVTVAER